MPPDGSSRSSPRSAPNRRSDRFHDLGWACQPRYVIPPGPLPGPWRTQRWRLFRLNTPGWMNTLLGPQPRDAYAEGPEVVARLSELGSKARCASTPRCNT
jgi:hypothetical protein